MNDTSLCSWNHPDVPKPDLAHALDSTAPKTKSFKLLACAPPQVIQQNAPRFPPPRRSKISPTWGRFCPLPNSRTSGRSEADEEAIKAVSEI